MVATVDADRSVHSSHSYFLRPVDIGADVRYDVELLRDGRGFSTRQARGVQNGKTVFISTASFQVPVAGDDRYQRAAPPQLHSDPESVTNAQAALAGVTGDAATYWVHGRSFDIRRVEGPVYVDVVKRQPAQALWIKAFSDLGDDPDVHRLALAYICDYTILESLLRMSRTSWSTPGLVTASLDHSMWFHRPGRVDEWVLYAQEAISDQSNRGLARGHFYTREGQLLVTVAQEGLLRIPSQPNDTN